MAIINEPEEYNENITYLKIALIGDISMEKLHLFIEYPLKII